MRQCTTEDCEIGVELLEQSDLSARASAHLAMQAWTAFPCNHVAEGIADAERALALARATRDAHAEGLIRRDRCGAVRQQRAVRDSPALGVHRIGDAFPGRDLTSGLIRITCKIQ